MCKESAPQPLGHGRQVKSPLRLVDGNHDAVGHAQDRSSKAMRSLIP